MTYVDWLIVASFVISALATVMVARVLWAVIALAGTSVVVTIVMFRFNAPLAAVFELSVCAGLIPAIFISAISLTRRLTPDQVAERRREKLRRFWFLPILLVVIGFALSRVDGAALLQFSAKPALDGDVKNVLWGLRQIDLLGQVVALLGGAFGVVVLLKELKRAD